MYRQQTIYIKRKRTKERHAKNSWIAVPAVQVLCVGIWYTRLEHTYTQCKNGVHSIAAITTSSRYNKNNNMVNGWIQVHCSISDLSQNLMSYNTQKRWQQWRWRRTPPQLTTRYFDTRKMFVDTHTHAVSDAVHVWMFCISTEIQTNPAFYSCSFVLSLRRRIVIIFTI